MHAYFVHLVVLGNAIARQRRFTPAGVQDGVALMENETLFVRHQEPGDVRQRLGGAAAVTTNKAPL